MTNWIGVVALCSVAAVTGCADETPAASDGAATTPCSPVDGSGAVVADGVISDGTRVVVIEPANATPEVPFRVFYGTAEGMIERRFVGRWNAGTTRAFQFDLDGATLTAIFTNERSGSGATTRLVDAAERSRPMTTVTGAPGAGLTFSCF